MPGNWQEEHWSTSLTQEPQVLRLSCRQRGILGVSLCVSYLTQELLYQSSVEINFLHCTSSHEASIIVNSGSKWFDAGHGGTDVYTSEYHVTHTFLVVNGLMVEGLLGANFLEQHKAVIDSLITASHLVHKVTTFHSKDQRTLISGAKTSTMAIIYSQLHHRDTKSIGDVGLGVCKRVLHKCDWTGGASLGSRTLKTPNA